MLGRGFTFILQRDGDPCEHLWFVVSDVPCASDDVLTVSLTSYKGTGREDLTCTLDVGDHPFVKTASLVFYREAWITSIARMRDRLKRGDASPHKPATPSLVARITRGFEDSPHAPHECIDLLKRQGLLP